MENTKPRRKIITDLDVDAKKAEARLANIQLSNVDIYPLDAPGMPLPGPDFMEYSRRIEHGEDKSDLVKAQIKGEDGKKKTVITLQVSDTLYDLHRQALRVPGYTMPIQVKAGQRKQVTFVPGHIWGQYVKEYEKSSADCPSVTGPQPAEVMVIGKMPGKQEVQDGRCFIGETGKLLVECLRQLHVKNTSKWYVTNLCKFSPPDGNNILTEKMKKDCMPLLHQELRIVRPKYILCLGADASKALLGDKSAGVDAMEGRVKEITFPIHIEHTDDEEKEVYHTALVMTVLHPAAVARAPEQRRRLERGLARFDMLTRGIRFDLEEKDIDHRTIRTLEELEQLCWEIDHDPLKTDNWIALDAEWHGEHPVNKGSYVRTIQFAWRPKHAAGIVWFNEEGKPAFKDQYGVDARKRGVELLNKFFSNKRICGHFLVADLEWMTYIGLNQTLHRFKVPLYDKPIDELPQGYQRLLNATGFESGQVIPAWVRTKWEGGWDTGLAGHAIEETAQLGLETLAIRYTTVPRYDVPLDEWKKAYCRSKGIKPKALEGYGPCPDNILLPYGIYDADTTLRLMYEQMPLIDCDYEGNNCRESFWESMITAKPILEIHKEGILVDKQRIDELTMIFMEARTTQEAKIREWAMWPDFNIRSVMQVREFLFGEKYNGKKTATGGIIKIRPQGAKSLYLDPILDTSKPPKKWWEIREKKQEDEHTPGTNKTILGVLAQDNPDEQTQVQWLRDHRFLDQVLKSVLRPPLTDKQGNLLTAEDEETGKGADTSAAALTSIDPSTGMEASPYANTFDNLSGLLYDAGLASVICSDGKVRTHLYPTTETKRWRSARPNLQNISKRRDGDYLRMLGPEKYKHKLRSIFMAEPGMALVEADFKSAELYCMAIMSSDPLLLEHCTRNQLPENDPLFYDIHSNIAVVAFGLNCQPTKKGLEDAGKISLRVAAKNVIFGIAYGRGAAAIALQCKEEGNPISVENAQQIINTVLQMYAGLVPFFDEAKRRSHEQRWICSCFGAFRRFPWTDDHMLAGEFERQAMNFPIQSMVASAMDRAIAYIQDYRDNVIKDPTMFRLKLQIHDAIILSVPYRHIEYVAKHVLPFNMTDRVSIWPATLDGVPTGGGPFNLGVDVEVFNHWGEKFPKAQCEEFGIPVEFAAKEKKKAA